MFAVVCRLQIGKYGAELLKSENNALSRSRSLEWIICTIF